MKKVAFLCCLFCGLITQAVGATYNCKPEGIGSFDRDWSNYLFMGKSNYDEGIALVCGGKGTDGCEHGTMVYLFGEYYFQGSKYFIRNLYKCDTSDGGYWDMMLRTDFNKCSEADKAKLKKFDRYSALYALYAYDVEYRSGYAFVDGICWESNDWIPENKRTDPYATKKDSETKPAQDAKQKQPAQTQSGDAEENAEGKWREPCSQEDLLKVPHATAGRYVYINAQNPVKCAATECEEGYYLVRNAAGQSQGWCQKGTDPHATTNTSETTSEQGATSDTSGADVSGTDATDTGKSGPDTTGADASAQNQPGGGTSGQVQPTAPVVNKSPCDLNQPGWLVFEGRCITDTKHQNILAERQAAKVRALAQKIESTATQLDSMSSRFKVSVWKDAEGKFNTARLASDSIAGVVLGAAGGLITSHVVKKNQVENGFQDIKCTIGGLSVANWGDEFSVGIQ